MEKLILRTIVLIFILSATPFCAFAAGAGIFDNNIDIIVRNIIFIIGAFIWVYYLGTSLLARILNNRASPKKYLLIAVRRFYLCIAIGALFLFLSYLILRADSMFWGFLFLILGLVIFFIAIGYGCHLWTAGGRFYEAGEESAKAKDYENAMKFFLQATERGHVGAQNCIGYMYSYGLGVERDDTEAMKWYRKAAEQGDVKAQCNLGSMYEDAQDYAEAIKWYRKSAEQGLARAQCRLGYMYENGLGVDTDYKEAIGWYGKAAEQEDLQAQCNIGNMFEFGLGVDTDYKEAIGWYGKAAEMGYAPAQCNIGYMYQYGHGVERDYTEAKRWYCKAAEQGNSEAKERLKDLDVQKQAEIDRMSELLLMSMGYDTQTASWYRKHAEQGNAQAQNKLGVMYLYGLGVGKDYAEAMKWFRKSAEQGYMDAQFTMGIMYEKGLGVERDDTEAIKWYRKAADQGDSEAKEKLENLDAGIELEETESENRVPQKQNDASSSSVIPKRIIKIIGGIAIILIACYGIINTYYQSQREDYFEEGHFPGEDEPDFSKHIDVLTAMAEKGYEATKDTKEEFSSYEEEYEHYLKLNKRSGKSEYHIGTMYFLGRGISKGYFESYLDHKGGIRRKDYRKALIHYYRAIDWEFRAMNSDDCPPEAKLEMGYMYTHGVLVERDLDNAKKLLENVLASTPASSDYAKEAQKILGDSIYRAEFKKYLKDAQEGYSEALKEVGRCYASGIGVERNPDKAKEWFQKAAEREKQLEDIEVPDVIKDLMKDITKKCIDDIKSGRVR